ncbi:hypothetical protein [Streptomyces sp. NPDC005548]|uniref:hypothetical protein n=1 Tax=Streptomyces sp. NPDC005548 TaxID=3364724 RepID=UPI0036A8CD98
MSSVYFTSPSSTAELKGSERAWLGGLVNDIATGALSLSTFGHAEQMLGFVDPAHYLYLDPSEPKRPGWQAAWASSYETSFRVDMGRAPLVQFQGRSLSTSTLALNTALILGNDPVKLGARIHAQCELNCWVDGPDRAWMAGIIDHGLEIGVYRRGAEEDPQGWEQVAELLRSRGDEPVVLYDSIGSEGFPSAYLGDWMPAWPEGVPQTHEGWELLTEDQRRERDERSDAWYDLSAQEQWDISLPALRAKTGHGLQIRPDNWRRFHFGHGLSVLDLVAHDAEDRIAAKLGVPA